MQSMQLSAANLSQEDQLRLITLIGKLQEQQKEVTKCKSMVELRDMYLNTFTPIVTELADLELKAQGKTNG